MNEELNLRLTQLEAALPDSGSFGAGGLLATIGAFIAAVRSGDAWTAFSLGVDLLVMIRDAMAGGTNFGAASALPGMDWATLLQVIFAILGALKK